LAPPTESKSAAHARVRSPAHPVARSSLEQLQRTRPAGPRVAPIHGEPNGEGAQRDQVQLILQTALDAIAVVDDQRRFVRVNRSAIRVLRTPVERLLRSRLDDFSPPEHAGLLSDLWAKFASDGTQWGHYEIRRADGTRAMVEYRSYWDFGDGEHLIALREIAGRAGLEDELWARRARMGLSPRELEVLQLVAEGRSAPEIGELLFVSAGTVKTHLKNIYGKLGACDRASAVAEALRRGLIE
jgi:DNA-binding CsgD family transcriptional regulator